MRKSLISSTALFVVAFLPLHVLPPLLSNISYRLAIGDSFAMIVSLTHQVCFAGAGVLILLSPARLREAIAKRPALLAALCVLPALISLLDSGMSQIIGKAASGLISAGLVASFYRRIKAENAYEQLPKIFGLSALVLESCALMVGYSTNSWGVSAGKWICAIVTVILALVVVNSKDENLPQIFSRPHDGSAMFDFSGTASFMVVAVLAYGGFFLMLLSLGTLQFLPNGALISGVAIFSTAFAFSTGNLIPLERLALFSSHVAPVRLGCIISVSGSVLVWFGYTTASAASLLSGVVCVAFGNGITISRCFQKAILTSIDGFSAPLATMVAVMLLPVGLTFGSTLIGASAPVMQLLAFSIALLVILSINSNRFAQA